MSDGEAQIFDLSANRSWTYQAEVSGPALWEAFSPFEPLVDRAEVRLGPDGLFISALDPARCTAIELNYDCIHRADGILEVPVHIPAALDEMPSYLRDSARYRVTVHHDPDGEDRFSVVNASAGTTYETDVPERTSKVPDEFPTPEEPYQVDCKIPAPKIRGTLRALSETDCECLRLAPRDGEIVVQSVGTDTGSAIESWPIEADVSEGPCSYYSTDFLVSIVDGLWPDGEVRVRFGEEQGLELTNDGIRYLLAHRVVSGFEEDES